MAVWRWQHCHPRQRAGVDEAEQRQWPHSFLHVGPPSQYLPYYLNVWCSFFIYLSSFILLKEFNRITKCFGGFFWGFSGPSIRRKFKILPLFYLGFFQSLDCIWDRDHFVMCLATLCSIQFMILYLLEYIQASFFWIMWFPFAYRVLA